jgi:hypothetical protein
MGLGGLQLSPSDPSSSRPCWSRVPADALGSDEKVRGEDGAGVEDLDPDEVIIAPVGQDEGPVAGRESGAGGNATGRKRLPGEADASRVGLPSASAYPDPTGAVIGLKPAAVTRLAGAVPNAGYVLLPALLPGETLYGS